MYVERLCKICKKPMRAYSSLQNKCPECIKKTAKPIKQAGKQAKLWKDFRDKIAIPHLDRVYGHVCSVPGCNVTSNLDVDHIKNRGSHPELRYKLSNMQYLCREHHRMKTDGKLTLETTNEKEETSE